MMLGVLGDNYELYKKYLHQEDIRGKMAR